MSWVQLDLVLFLTCALSRTTAARPEAHKGGSTELARGVMACLFWISI